MLMIPEKPTADRDQIARFVNVLFRNCRTKGGLPFGGLVALRAFGPDSNVAHISWAALDKVIDQATDVATDMARREAVVFCPPVCLFKEAEKPRAREADILAAPVIAMDFDKNPDAGRAALTEMLGPPTLVVASGGLWQGQQNAHLYWRLKEPAVGPDAIALLKAVRKKATALSGGDPTNVPACHPLRWPGSWHTKSALALCHIIEEAEDVELTLEDAAHRLGVDPQQVMRDRQEKAERKGSGTEDNPADVKSAIDYLATVRKDGIPAEGAGSDNFTFTVAARLRDLGVSESTANDLLDIHFTPHSGYDDAWVEAKVANAYKHAQNPPGVQSVTLMFDVLPDEAENPFAQVELNAFNREADEPEVSIHATPYTFPDVGEIKPREWLYGTHYIRAFVSATVAPSGVGKSSLEIVEALAMASGKPLLGIQPKGQFKVWLWNGEDPLDELNRRVAAAMQHYGLSREDLGDRLFIDSGRTMEIVLAQETREGVKINAPVEAAIMGTIELNTLDVIQIDPFVSSHRVSENDNGAIDLVSKRWARIADAGRVSIELVHHVRKLNGSEITVEDSRGAVALIATSRSARAIARMTKGEAARLGLEGVQRRLFRFADGKNNLALPADSSAEWLELCSVALGNGPGDGLERLIGGDSVGVVQRFAGAVMAPADVDERGVALSLLREGSWRRDIRAGDAWAGCAIAQAMRLDVGDENDRGRVKAILTGWIKDGTLIEVTKLDAKRMQKSFIEVAERDDLSETAATDIFE